MRNFALSLAMLLTLPIVACSDVPPTAGIRDVTSSTFEAEVLRAKEPVVVLFKADWCRGCNELSTALQKAVRAAGGKVKLLAMDIQKYPEVATQLGVSSLPVVYAYGSGRAKDHFVGALPESQVTAFIERITK